MSECVEPSLSHCIHKGHRSLHLLLNILVLPYCIMITFNICRNLLRRQNYSKITSFIRCRGLELQLVRVPWPATLLLASCPCSINKQDWGLRGGNRVLRSAGHSPVWRKLPKATVLFEGHAITAGEEEASVLASDISHPVKAKRA